MTRARSSHGHSTKPGSRSRRCGPASWASAFARARGEVERVWGDDERLDRTAELPWATLPGRDALEAYTHEFTAINTRPAAYLGRRP
ncbi:hypothetical protein [Streptomyces endophyticus]|uniref:Uncharacterized protein n=1 Tax=Streptomyces endophyticus TaxID=714166 RepID=A0ABU6F4A1_9ACTN|nr:hypothetical protein [Streptomyces endophyticus]MEB8338831.1 hypothetical protein [Streptomyces endophyticus]